MTPAIGGTGMEALGAMLGGQGSPPGGSPQPGAPGQSPTPSAVAPGAMAGAPGMDVQRQMLEQTMGAIRQLGEGVKHLVTLVPMAADEAQQIQQLLKQIVVKAAQGAPMQTGSGMAVPGNGGGLA